MEIDEENMSFITTDTLKEKAQSLARTIPDTAEDFAKKQQLIAMKNARNKAYEKVRQYNDNPRSVDDHELPFILKQAEAFGLPTALGRRKDTANWWDALGGIGLSAADTMLLGLLKNEWYRNRRNKNHVLAGKIAGIAASIFLPTSWTAGAKVGGNALANLGRTGVKYLTLPGLAGGAKRLYGTYKLAGAASTLGAKSATQLAKGGLQKAAAKAITSGQAKTMSKLLGSKAFQTLASKGAGAAVSGAKGLLSTLAPYTGAAAGGAAGIRGLFSLIKLFKEQGVEDPYAKAMEIYKQRQKQMPQRPQQRKIS